MTHTTSDRDSAFHVPRRYTGTPWELTRGSRQLLDDWYDALDPFDRTIGYGLFACTSEKDPAGWQEVRLRDLLDIIEVARYTSATGANVHHGQHYRDGIAALLRLFNVAVPIRKRTLRKEGKRYIRELSFGYVRLLQGLQLVYRDDKGRPIDLDDERYADFRVNISERYRTDDNARPRDRQPKGGQARVYALAKLDDSGNVMVDDSGKPVVRPPEAYRFRWGTDIVEDLTNSRRKGNGHGWLRMSRRVFGVLRELRARNSPTAMRLFELVISDIIAQDEAGRTLVKGAKLVFRALGFSEPGSISRSGRKKKDGRWAENVRRVKAAVRILQDLGVLLPGSDLEPQDMATGPAYMWKRAEDWTFTAAIDIGVGPNDIIMKGDPILSGKDVRAARKAAGLTLQEFAQRFGRSVSFWSHVEAGRREVPEEIRDTVTAFVAGEQRA